MIPYWKSYLTKIPIGPLTLAIGLLGGMLYYRHTQKVTTIKIRRLPPPDAPIRQSAEATEHNLQKTIRNYPRQTLPQKPKRACSDPLPPLRKPHVPPSWRSAPPHIQYSLPLKQRRQLPMHG